MRIGTDRNILSAIDIWSVGIIMLAFLTKRFPIFNANDDNQALIELATIFGSRRMEQCAMMHSELVISSSREQLDADRLPDRTFKCTIPSVVDADTNRIPEWIGKVNPDLWNSDGQPDPKAYLQDVDLAVDLCKRILHLDCTKRLTAKQALEHPFLREKEN